MQNTAIGKALSRSRNALTTKMLLVMRMTAFLLILFFQASAFTESAAQVTLKESSATLEKVLKTIQQQSAYDLVFDKALLQAKAKPVTVNVTNVPVKEALDKVFSQQELLTYSLSGKIISVMERKGNPAMMLAKTEIPVIDVRGKVTDENGKPVVGASVQVKGSNKGTTTDENGFYVLSGVDEKATLVISAVNIETREVGVNGRNEINLVAKVKVSQLEDVAVTVNTGYQQLKPNEVTGSVVTISKEQLDQRVAPDIISKLEGITNGLVFNKNPLSGESMIRIRGESTLFANPNPLIVLDNFPYDGNINNINPNDIESVTILKDAAAASIWGVQAGNGVIVITTKKGRSSSPLKIEFNTNITVGEKVNMFYSPQITASDYIDFEAYLFSRGYYNATLNNLNKPAVSPVVEILNNRKSGIISAVDSAAQIDALRQNDYRNSLLNDFFRNPVRQQHQLNLSGGNSKMSYYLSGGYDKGLSDAKGNSDERVTLVSQNIFKPAKKIELSVGLIFNESTNRLNSSNLQNLYPYSKLKDASGRDLRFARHREVFEDTIENRGFNDWKYYPLQESNYIDNRNKISDIRVTGGLKYTILNGLTAEAFYQYQRSASRNRSYVGRRSYAVRNLLNTYAILDSDGNYTGSNYPDGGILSLSYNDLIGHYGRVQLGFNKKISIHAIAMLAGAEARQVTTESNAYSLYGYSEDNGSFFEPQNYTTPYLTYPSLSTSVLPVNPNYQYGGTNNRFKSYFSNMAYTLLDKYTLSGSVRFDGSNYFGVNTNQKTVPLWSIGYKWDISKETFYHFNTLPQLSLRLTYGYNGNLARNLAAVATLRYQNNDSYTGRPFSVLSNIPNPELRWEKTGQFNVGVDFISRNHRVAGSIEYYHKKGVDLIGDAPIDPTTGVTELRGNFSNMKSNGIDLSITTINTKRAIKWHTTLIFNYAAETLTRYDIPSNALTYLNAYYSVTPVVGKPLYSLFSYRFAGLDPGTGDPMFYQAGTVTRNYSSAVANQFKVEDLVYSGRFNPPAWGSVLNSFYWKNLSLTFNITYKMGHYFRRSSINYSQFVSDWKLGHSDYANRWQRPGDELTTTVPSFVYPVPARRDKYYSDADILVEKADHIRLQFLNLSYAFKNKVLKKLSLQQLQVFGYANNLGIIWRANDKGIDPDYPYQNYPPSRTYSVGVKAIF